MMPEEVNLLLHEFLPEKMREAKVTADRHKCCDVLGYLMAFQKQPWSERKNDAKGLSELAGIGEAECQEILAELVNIKFVLKLGQRYVLADDFDASWELRRTEAVWKM